MTGVAQVVWSHRVAPRHVSAPDASVLASTPAPADAREMSRLRRRVRSAVRSRYPVGAGATPDAGPTGADRDAGLSRVVVPDAADRLADGLERLDLVLEELASNGVRHGRAPVHVAVHTADGGWLVAVTDAAPDLPPRPVTDRDPAEGGMGLPMVARLAEEHGWSVTGGRKTVWALVTCR